MTLFCLLILTSRKDFVVYQDINAEPTKVTDNNFKDKVMIYCNLQIEGSCLGHVCEWQSCWNELVRHEKRQCTSPACFIHQVVLAASPLTYVSQTEPASL